MTYRPRQGDLVAMDFDSQSGHEQKGRRPAIVVSNELFNRLCGTAIVCPITSTERRFPTRIPLDERTRTFGFVMCEQMKALDLETRRAEYLETLPPDILEEVLDVLDGFFERMP